MTPEAQAPILTLPILPSVTYKGTPETPGRLSPVPPALWLQLHPGKADCWCSLPALIAHSPCTGTGDRRAFSLVAKLCPRCSGQRTQGFSTPAPPRCHSKRDKPRILLLSTALKTQNCRSGEKWGSTSAPVLTQPQRYKHGLPRKRGNRSGSPQGRRAQTHWCKEQQAVTPPHRSPNKTTQ